VSLVVRADQPVHCKYLFIVHNTQNQQQYTTKINLTFDQIKKMGNNNMIKLIGYLYTILMLIYSIFRFERLSLRSVEFPREFLSRYCQSFLN
jgi:hypothetical protein